MEGPLTHDEVIAAVGALCGSQVESRLLDADGNELVRWEGLLIQEEDQRELFLIGAKPFLVDRGDMAAAEPIDPAGVRIRGRDGTTVELIPA